MLDALLVLAVLLAASACPAMMFYNHRRGRASACCPPRRQAPADLVELRAQRDALDAHIAGAQDSHATRS